MTRRAKITSKGQLTVPKSVRERLGVGPGDELEFVEDGGRFVVRKLVTRSPFAAYRGHLEHLAGRDPDEIVREIRGRD
jgi:AbrB family looped-hinge helix DNA binding protein